MFADDLITMSLLEALNIGGTFLFYGEYYHLMYKIFPKPANFGKLVYDMIFDNLKIMLSSETEEQWDDAYQDARSIICSYPREKSYLDKIYNNPKYYSRYYVKSILCSARV